MATKGDLAAVKADLKELEQKLNGKIDSVEQKLSLKIGSVETTVNTLAIELAKTQADVREIKYDMATKMSTKDDISRVLKHIDAFGRLMGIAPVTALP